MVRDFLCVLLGVIVLMGPGSGSVLIAAEPDTQATSEGATEGAEEAHVEQPFLLDVDSGTFVWTLLLFLILLGVLSKFVWPNILKGLLAREEKQRSDLAAAEQANQTAQQTLAEYQQKLTEAHAEARKLIEHARADADKAGAQRVSEIEAEIGRMRERATDDIKLARQQALQDLYGHAASLATAVAGKVLQREIDDSDTQRLVDESLNELGRLEDAG
ncbi:MAG: ATP synthase F0 subunit B [Planctomycetaceae bacterium]|nr:ATP synthase F0 subunit B [Planctomycetaceae bacterium]